MKYICIGLLTRAIQWLNILSRAAQTDREMKMRPFEFLDANKDRMVVEMFGLLKAEYGMTIKEAREYVRAWLLR